jgi:hypothetical protein
MRVPKKGGTHIVTQDIVVPSNAYSFCSSLGILLFAENTVFTVCKYATSILGNLACDFS